MWVLLTKDLPIVNAPPRLSAHFSWPWGEDKGQAESKWLFYSEVSRLYFHANGYAEHDFRNARRIIFNGNVIRIFPDEFSEIPKDRMRIYLEGGYELVSDPSVMDKQPKLIMTRGRKTVYDAALVDGCSIFEATMVCMGYDPTEAPPPIGWLKPPKDVCDYFGVEIA